MTTTFEEQLPYSFTHASQNARDGKKIQPFFYPLEENRICEKNVLTQLFIKLWSCVIRL